MAERDRHLAAVWFADIVGYTQLAGQDEDAAFGLIDMLQQHAGAVIDEHGGRLVKCIGDAVLAEFRSTEAAFRAALALRDGFAVDSREFGHPSQLRIGLHVGDLRTARDGDVYGDGVNTASRLQGLAEPGQIVVSQDVWRQLRPRAEYELRSLGERRLKGIAGPAWAFSADRRPEGRSSDLSDAADLPDTPFSRRLLKLARIGPLYVVGSVAVIVAFGLLRTALDLPSWVMPVVIVLLAIGFVVVLGTSWAESRPAWKQSLAARPHSWDVGMADLADSISRRRLPELTWPRALWGGVAVFLLVLGAAVLQPWLERESSLLRPRAAYAAPSPSVVILPFTVEGAADDLWSEGVPDLMALSIEASRQLRVIGARTVNRRLPNAATRLAPDDLYTLAQDFGARYAIMGRLVLVDDLITLQADVYDVQQRERLGVATVDGSIDRIASHVDVLATRALAFGTDTESSLVDRPPLSRLATRSIPALQAYLRGEQLYRRSRLSGAGGHFAAAVEHDPTFALARYRLALTEGWLDLPHQPRVSIHQIEAERHVARLSERDSLLVTGFGQLNRREQAALQTLSHLVVRFPDDAEGWFLLGDARFHLTPAGTRTAATEALQEALRLDAGYGPAYVHLIDAAVEAKDTAQVRAWLAAYRRVDPGSPLLSGFEWALQLAQTPPPTAAPVVAESTERTGRAPASADAARNPPARTDAPDRQAAARSLAEAEARAAERVRLDSLARVVQQRAATPGLDAAAVREAAAWQEAALLARATNQPAQAEAHYRRAHDILASARPAPAPEPAPRPPDPAEAAAPQRAEIASVLAELERALEAKDVNRIQEVWTSLTPGEADRFRRSLPGMSNLDVSFQIVDVSPAPGAAVVRVQTTYAFETARGQPERQAFGQVFRIARPAGKWVIVQSSAP